MLRPPVPFFDCSSSTVFSSGLSSQRSRQRLIYVEVSAQIDETACSACLNLETRLKLLYSIHQTQTLCVVDSSWSLEFPIIGRRTDGQEIKRTEVKEGETNAETTLDNAWYEKVEKLNGPPWSSPARRNYLQLHIIHVHPLVSLSQGIICAKNGHRKQKSTGQSS